MNDLKAGGGVEDVGKGFWADVPKILSTNKKTGDDWRAGKRMMLAELELEGP